MKNETITYTKNKIILDVEDVKKLLPDEKFEYTMYRDYRDEITQDQFEKYQPNIDTKIEKGDGTFYYPYKNEDGTYNYPMIVGDRKINIENDLRDSNIERILDEIDKDLRDKVEAKLKKDGVEYDILEFDFYPDDLYSIDFDLDYILSRSRVVRNVVRYNNYDGFYEGETYEDGEGLKELVDLYPELVTKEQLEYAVNDCMYTGSDLKINFRHNMKDFLDIIESGGIDISGCTAVLHLGINGSGSSDFELGKGKVEFDKQVGKTQYDRRDRQFDGKYGIQDVYGCIMNDCY